MRQTGLSNRMATYPTKKHGKHSYRHPGGFFYVYEQPLLPCFTATAVSNGSVSIQASKP